MLHTAGFVPPWLLRGVLLVIAARNCAFGMVFWGVHDLWLTDTFEATLSAAHHRVWACGFFFTATLALAAAVTRHATVIRVALVTAAMLMASMAATFVVAWGEVGSAAVVLLASVTLSLTAKDLLLGATTILTKRSDP